MHDATLTCSPSHDEAVTCTEPDGSAYSASEHPGELWAIVLTEGGERHRSPTFPRRWRGQRQYRLESRPPLPLPEALERIGLLVTGKRTFVVTHASRAGDVEASVAGFDDVRVVSQPCDRGTAAGVLLPAHFIHARDPRGRVAVFSADSVTLDEAIWRHLSAVTRFAAMNPEWLVLLGAEPTAPDSCHGWIEPGECVGWAGTGSVNEVRGFWERPSERLARGLLRQGCLWPSFAFVTSVAVLVEIGFECLPLLHDRLTRLEIFSGTQYEPWALRQAYEFAPSADFARAVLESPAAPLAVSQIPEPIS